MQQDLGGNWRLWVSNFFYYFTDKWFRPQITTNPSGWIISAFKIQPLGSWDGLLVRIMKSKTFPPLRGQ